MNSSWIPFFGYVHLLSLMILCWISASKGWSRPIPRLSAACGLFWSNLVIVGNIAALGNSLNQPIVYACLSWGLAALLWIKFRDIRPLKSTSLSFIQECSQREKLLIRILQCILLLAFGCALAIALGIIPTNFDSLMYRFPRVYWYVDSGTLLHHGAPDFRTKFYPLNGVLLYAPIAIYRLPATFFPLISLASWSLIVLINYEIARSLGFRKLIAWIAAFLIGAAPNVFAQATSTNDEILSAAALTCGFYFAILAWKQPRILHYVMAGIFFGLSFGTKLHFYFHLWMFPIAAMVFLWLAAQNYRRTMAEVKQRTLPIIATGLIALMLSAPFFLWNKASSNQMFMESNFIVKPLDVSIGFQNFALHLGQMLLSPVPDLLPTSNAIARPVYESFNKLVDPLFTWHNEDPSYWFSSYRFDGAVPANHFIYYSEETIWHGFLPYLILIALFALASQWRKDTVLLGLLLGASFWIYYISLTFQTRYFDTMGIYLTYAAACIGLLFACFAERPLTQWKNRLRWGAIGFVILTHCVFMVNLMHKNAMRNLSMIVSAESLPFDPSRPEIGMVNKLQQFSRIHSVYTHWAVPYFNLINWTPNARHSSSPVPIDSSDVTNVYIVQAAPSWGFLPVKLFPGASAGLVKCGHLFSSYGKEWVFSDPSSDLEEETKYIILEWRPDPSDGALMVKARHPGRHEGNLIASYILKKDGVILTQAEGAGNAWIKLENFDKAKSSEYQLEASLFLEQSQVGHGLFGLGEAESIKE